MAGPTEEAGSSHHHVCQTAGRGGQIQGSPRPRWKAYRVDQWLSISVSVSLSQDHWLDVFRLLPSTLTPLSASSPLHCVEPGPGAEVRAWGTPVPGPLAGHVPPTGPAQGHQAGDAHLQRPALSGGNHHRKGPGAKGSLHTHAQKHSLLLGL